MLQLKYKDGNKVEHYVKFVKFVNDKFTEFTINRKQKDGSYHNYKMFSYEYMEDLQDGDKVVIDEILSLSQGLFKDKIYWTAQCVASIVGKAPQSSHKKANEYKSTNDDNVQPQGYNEATEQIEDVPALNIVSDMLPF